MANIIVPGDLCHLVGQMILTEKFAVINSDILSTNSFMELARGTCLTLNKNAV